MSVKIKNATGDQSTLFWVMLGLMVMFYFVNLITDYLFAIGATPRQIGGDMSSQAFKELMLVTVLVAQAGGRSLVNKLSGDPVAAQEEPAKEPQKQ